jgi:BSD domain-containing protein
VYQEASKEVAELGQDAAKGLSTLHEQLATRARGLSITTAQQTGEASGEKAKDGEDKGEATPTKARSGETGESMSGSSTYLDKFRIEAARRIKELQKAEDAADEALLRFGSNIRNFLKDAVSVAPPSNGQGSTVLFESKDASGKRVIHASRQDAQLHVIHTTTEGFAKDPNTDEYTTWGKDFDVEKKTGDISDDLAKYPELRQTMEKLVPDQVPYADFWRRYYFLRHGLDAAEARRRDLLKGMLGRSTDGFATLTDGTAAAEDDEVGWGDDSDDDEPKSEQKKPAAEPARAGSAASSTTIAPPAPESTKAPTPTPAPAAGPAAAAAPATAAAPASSLKPAESRKSNDEKSQADSEASYDVVGERSGVPSQAPSSPKESRKGDDSDDEDWE